MDTRLIVPLDTFLYSYLCGPVVSEAELDTNITEGNCRLALQIYFYRQHNLFLERDEIYLPGGYKTLGKFIFKEEVIDFSTLLRGDIIYAQNLRNKLDVQLNRSREDFPDYDTWLYHLHSAIYIGNVAADSDETYVYHASSVSNGPALWPLQKFLHYYYPVSVKRIDI